MTRHTPTAGSTDSREWFIGPRDRERLAEGALTRRALADDLDVAAATVNQVVHATRKQDTPPVRASPTLHRLEGRP